MVILGLSYFKLCPGAEFVADLLHFSFYRMKKYCVVLILGPSFLITLILQTFCILQNEKIFIISENIPLFVINCMKLPNIRIQVTL